MYKLRQVLLAALLVCWVAAVGQAQIFKQVPANALVVVKIANLQATSKKIADFAAPLGLAVMNPDFTDPLTAVENKAGIMAGINKAGDAGFIYIDPDDSNAKPDKSMIVLIPVSDYQAFLGNLVNTTTDGGITTGFFKNDKNNPEAAYVAKWGEYAAISPTKELVVAKPEGLVPAAATAKEVAGKDFVAYVNFKDLGPKLAGKVEKGRAEALKGLEKMLAEAKDPKATAQLKPYMAVIKVALNQVMNVAAGAVNETNAVVLSANVGAPGIAITEVVDFTPDSYAGKLASQITNTPNALLTGLPEGKYILYGGSTSNPKLAVTILSDFLDPISAELAKVQDPLAKPIQKLIDVIKIAAAADTGETFGVLVPVGQLGNDPLLQMVGIRTGDAKVLMAAAKDAVTAQDDLMQVIGGIAGPAAQTSKTTYTANAKVIDGISFNAIHTDFTMNPTTPQAAQMSQFFQYLYGPNGMDALAAVVNDKTYLGAIGVSDAVISSTLTTIKADKAPLADTDEVKTVAAQLPAQRVAVMYFALDQLVNAGLNTAKQMGIDLGVKLPDNLPPIGVAISGDGSALRIDSYVPTTLVQAITGAAMQIYMKRAGGGGGPGGPGM